MAFQFRQELQHGALKSSLLLFMRCSSFVILYPLSTCPLLFSINSAHRLSIQTWFPDSLSFIEQLASSWPWTVQKAWGKKPKTLPNMFFTSWLSCNLLLDLQDRHNSPAPAFPVGLSHITEYSESQICFSWQPEKATGEDSRMPPEVLL